MSKLCSHPVTIFRRAVDVNSLQTRLTVGVVLTSLLGIGSMATWMGWRLQQMLIDNHKQNTSLLSTRLEDDVRYYAATMPPEVALQKVIDHRTTGDIAIWYELYTGSVLVQSETLTMGSWQNSGLTKQLMTNNIQIGQQILSIQPWYLAVCAREVSFPGLPPGTLYVAMDVTSAYQSLQKLSRMLLLTSLLMVSLLAVAVALYIRHALSPIRRLNQLASEVTAETLTDHQLNLKAAPTEVAEMVRTYNLMLTRLSTAWQQQKRFINDMSHELRTPLTLVQGYLESTLRRDHNLTPPQREGLKIAAQETDRTIKLLQELLDLARLNNGQMPLTIELIDLQEVVCEAVAMTEAEHLSTFETPSRVSIKAVNTPMAKADRNKLRIVLAELIDNALRYSDPDEPIQVEVSAGNQWGIVQVRDRGPGIPLHCLHDIFDPFYRVGEDRCSRTGGTGLGLTLVRSLVEAMQGHVSVQSQTGQGSVFTVSLPTQEMQP